MVLGPKKRVRVHTNPVSGSQTIEGVLLKKRPEIVLELAFLVTGPGGGDEDRVQIEGRVHILREHVAFWQVVR